MARKLKIEIDASWLQGRDKHYLPLPEGWNEMSADEQQKTIDDIAADIIWNRVSHTGRVVENGR